MKNLQYELNKSIDRNPRADNKPAWFGEYDSWQYENWEYANTEKVMYGFFLDCLRLDFNGLIMKRRIRLQSLPEQGFGRNITY